MKQIAGLLVAVLLAGCGRFCDGPKYQDGETVWYDVNGVTGTGVVVQSSPLEDGWYYQVDVGVDGAGERERPHLHETLLRRKK